MCNKITNVLKNKRIQEFGDTVNASWQVGNNSPTLEEQLNAVSFMLLMGHFLLSW